MADSNRSARSALARRGLAKAGAVCLVALAATVGGPAGPVAEAAEGGKPSGTVRIEQIQIAFIGSGNIGGGELTFRGKTYKFSIGGLGIGGIGASKIEATGEVYGLDKIEHFPGAWGQARVGAVAGDVSTGTMWLENGNGVRMRLDAKREGLQLSLGADAIYIQMK